MAIVAFSQIFMLTTFINLASVSFVIASNDIDERESWDGIDDSDNIEKRYMTSNQIRNKFISQSNRIAELGKKLDKLENSGSTDLSATKDRIDDASDDVQDLFDNKVDIEATLKKSCGYLDDLMDDQSPIVDCCINGFTVYCLTRAAILQFDSTFDTTKGDCTTCPDGLASS